MAKRLQEQEGRPLSVEDRDRLIAIETQDGELAKLLQEKVRFTILSSILYEDINEFLLGESAIEESSGKSKTKSVAKETTTTVGRIT